MTGTAERPSSHFGFGAPVLEEALLVEHRADSGWGAPEFLPRRAGDVPMASAAVQYGLSCFEGLKAFRGPDGSVHLFRADRHGERLAQSCARLCLPVLPPAEFVAHASAFVRRNAHHVPPHGQGALYVRPTIAAVEEYLGVRPARRHVFALLATPVPRPASRPMALWIEREYVRAAPGGIGAAKTGGNYAAGLLGAERARQRGFDQVVWLDAVQRRFVAEAGVMNLFVVLGDEVATPPLDGTILAGVTRDCCLTLMREWKMAPSERAVALDELVSAQRRGELREAFGTGTAACVVRIERMVGDGEELVPTGGDLAARLRDAIEAIQEGRAADPFGWRQTVADARSVPRT